jgi:hypothetical protein
LFGEIICFVCSSCCCCCCCCTQSLQRLKHHPSCTMHAVHTREAAMQPAAQQHTFLQTSTLTSGLAKQALPSRLQLCQALVPVYLLEVPCLVLKRVWFP